MCQARTTYTLIKLLTYFTWGKIICRSTEHVGWNIHDFVLVAQVISVHAEQLHKEVNSPDLSVNKIVKIFIDFISLSHRYLKFILSM